MFSRVIKGAFVVPQWYITAVRLSMNNLLAKNRDLRTTRDLLLPKLISGKLDVEDLDIGVDNEEPLETFE